MFKQIRNLTVGRGNFISGERLAVDDASVQALTVPSGAAYALISIEADASAVDSTKAVRWLETPDNLSGIYGHVFGDGAYHEIFGGDMNSYRFIGAEAGKTATIQVSYYG